MKAKLMHELQQVGEQLIPAVAYGDAAGLPVETMSHKKIQQIYGRVSKLMVTSANEYFVGEHVPGTWSDDTQLTLAVAQALMEADRFDIQAQADAHIIAFNETPIGVFKGKQKPRGWGGSTVNSMRRIIEGVGPLEAGEIEGVGNGVLMKLGPLAYWQYVHGVNDEQRYNECDQLTIMTHNSPVARVCTRVHSDVLAYLLSSNGCTTAQEFSSVVIESAAKHERILNVEGGEISKLFLYLNQSEPLNEAMILSHTDGKGFYAPQTLAMACGVFSANAGDYGSAVYGAVNLGGDTDSIASIVGAMELFASKSIVLPKDYLKVAEYKQLEEFSAQFAAKTVGVIHGGSG